MAVAASNVPSAHDFFFLVSQVLCWPLALPPEYKEDKPSPPATPPSDTLMRDGGGRSPDDGKDEGGSVQK